MMPVEEKPRAADGGPRHKFLMFPLSWVMAHVGRTTEVAKELREMGHEVVFAGEDMHHPKSNLGHAAAAGFRVVPVKEPAWHWAWERFHEGHGLLSFYDFCTSHRWAPLDEILGDYLRVIREEQPDLLVGDASVGVSTAGYILKLPAVGLLNAYNARFFKPFSLWRFFIKNWDRIAFARQRRRVYKAHGVHPVNAIELLRTIPLLSPDLPAFHHVFDEHPNWISVGPMVSEPPCGLPEWYDELADGTTNIYITMGSTGLLDQLLRRCYGALGAAPYRFVVTTAGQVSEETMDMAPGNFRFARYAPGSKILKHCAAMVFHGGNGTMYQALAAGVPMVGLPSHLEQEACIKVPVREGFGLRLNARKTSGARLLRAIDELVNNPTYREKAQLHAPAVREANGARRAAELLVAHARNGVPAGAPYIMPAGVLGFPGRTF